MSARRRLDVHDATQALERCELPATSNAAALVLGVEPSTFRRLVSANLKSFEAMGWEITRKRGTNLWGRTTYRYLYGRKDRG